MAESDILSVKRRDLRVNWMVEPCYVPTPRGSLEANHQYREQVLQEQVALARGVLEQIATGQCDPRTAARHALDCLPAGPARES